MTPRPLTLPGDEQSWAPFLSDRADGGLTRARACIRTLKDGSRRSPGEVLALWNDLAIALRSVEAIVELLAQVHPDEAVRTLAEEWEQECVRLVADRDLDRDLYDVLAAVDPSGLDTIARRFLDRSLRDFRRAGVDQPVETRERLRAIAQRSALLMQDFFRIVRDDDRSIRVAPDRLTGLPADFLADRPADDDGLITLTTDYPDLVPVQTYATDAEVRRELTLAYLNLGWPDNEDVLRELLALRAEQASLLGYASWPDYDCEIKMVGTSAALGQFIDELSELVAPTAARDVEALLELRRHDDPDATGITFADVHYYMAVARNDRYGVDDQQVRRYFDFDRVKTGLLDVTGRLFGLDYREVDAAAWHPDVTVHDVFAAGTAERLGRVYLDLHPRPGKYSHAAQFQLEAGVAGRHLPEAALVCNLPHGQLEHDSVILLFHEFGHVIHHIVGGRQAWLPMSGVATELDFIEAPSQLLEEWAWDPAVLRSFAVDETGTSIPAGLVAQMREANEFGRGRDTATQLFYAALSHRLHLAVGEDLTELLQATQKRYDVLEPIAGNHMHTGWLHLMQYTSGYYSYLWSLVIAKDMFSGFDPLDRFERQIAGRYRDVVLAAGGSRDAAALIEDFLGRPYSMEGFRRWMTAGGD